MATTSRSRRWVPWPGGGDAGPMALWNVMYDDWQMECCGEPFGVGDEVAWR
ncbi:DUF6578 domain-containing protein, partial [Streptomyces luteocolor]|uniref:DUF6578 domain-containing protein n=1 Tax=Streptomyces luteocolor TaxID=285500 RepID=UPI00350E3650